MSPAARSSAPRTSGGRTSGGRTPTAKTAKARPAYAVTSVDHALRLAAILQLEGRITVSEAAERLEVAPSTAHRLLSMLVYRDFAARDDRAYRVGPVLELAAHSHTSTATLRATALPHLQELVDQFDETANLTIRAGANARFIASIEGHQVLRVGNRAGMVFPAHLQSGGLVLLADLTDDEIRTLYAPAPGDEGGEQVDLEAVFARVRQVQEQGFALNSELSERGVLAVGHAVRDSTGKVVAALSIAMPMSRFAPVLLRPLVGALRLASRAVERDLVGAG